MSDNRLQRMAQVLVHYSLNVKKGELFCKDGEFVV